MRRRCPMFRFDAYKFHKDVKTTMIYTHVLNKGGTGIRNPADVI